jgi:sulfoxide reductase catalytic subunit YedY
MFTHFTKEEKSVHYPTDRQAFIGIKPYMIVIFGVIILGLIGAAWIQYLISGLPADPSLSVSPTKSSDPTGFPFWLNLSHWVNFFSSC